MKRTDRAFPSEQVVLWAALTVNFLLNCCHVHAEDAAADAAMDETATQLRRDFERRVKPFLAKHCVRCHNEDEMTSGIRVDHLTGDMEERHLSLWKGIGQQLNERAMPPEDEPQPTVAEREQIADWIREGMRFASLRKVEKNGSVRRLTVAQYRNTLRDLLGIDDDWTDLLPPDAVSKDGFVNNEQTMLLSPLLLEAFLAIAEKALDATIVDPDSRPVVQSFRMDLGKNINTKPCPDELILGANSHLLANSDFRVTQPRPRKPFDYKPLAMRTKFRFVEGYQGNATVRGWREYDSIYHAVFACMRGTNGYPKGLAYQPIPDGLLLRPAIPSAELFQIESTYGPKANFKISLRELPDEGKFRVRVRAAKYDDGLLLDAGAKSQSEGQENQVIAAVEPSSVEIPQAGIYQVDLQLGTPDQTIADASRLQEQLAGHWPLDGNLQSSTVPALPQGKLVGSTRFQDSPFGQAAAFDGEPGAVIVPRHEALNVGEGDFTVAAWIHPQRLQQGGIVCLGGYGYTHGWLLDMPNNKGILRLETSNAANRANGTVQSRPATIRRGAWQHVAAVVRRRDNQTRLYVNGFEVASGTIRPANLDNPQANLFIGRIPDANRFNGMIDEVRIYRRALAVGEIKALVVPGQKFVPPRQPDIGKLANLQLGERHFAGNLRQPAFLVARLPAGELRVAADYGGKADIDRIVFTRLSPEGELAKRFTTFAKRNPRIGVHLGLRRDCGSTLAAVGKPQVVSATTPQTFVFEGAIRNFPSPDVEKDNVNYLAGIREIGVRSEYTDGRDMPRLLLHSVEFEGPYFDAWPPAPHRRIFGDAKHEVPPPPPRP